jgi:hypothetical protein
LGAEKGKSLKLENFLLPPFVESLVKRVKENGLKKRDLGQSR